MTEKETQLLIEAKNCIDHARKWIKNIKPDFNDTGMYKIVSDKIDNHLHRREIEGSYTVAQLIKLLEKAPQSAIVNVANDCCGCCDEANEFKIYDGYVIIGSVE